jgi:hypothetical protein
VLAAMTSRQKWLAQEFWDQSRDQWSRLRVAVEANRITEATSCLKEYVQRFNEWTRLHSDLMIVSRSGQSTERVGQAVVPPGCTVALPFRDQRGLIDWSVTRRPDATRGES